ncbi:hypothetical protein BCR36DRAFT_342850 [Piromyces finnis]|uniref:Transglutaminase-like domain-containing protein n=1 Tax=Piromyces finnis TaxID=1754191 RepID=A0A1Y1VKV0_9FUNG|nr:hypothetical protein BCR36DRAFT_342850 [Piromyces finnis]|eukprot:ORX59100.1 hypothetical protein BCR36DRAFT_342850 [Piromyces finnis]
MNCNLIILLFLWTSFILLTYSQKVVEIEEFNDNDDDDETVFTGTIIKYLNVTEEMEAEKEENEVTTSATVKIFNETFYHQLNSNEKLLYDFLYEQCSQERPKTRFVALIDDYIDKSKVTMERVMTSFVFDNPQFWWIETYTITIKNACRRLEDNNYKILTNVTVDFVSKNSILNWITDEDIYKMNQEIQLETDILLYQIELLNIHTKYQLLQYLHDYIIRNTVYNTTAPSYVHTIYGPLVKHVGVCSGYSEVFKYIASFFGINVVLARSLTHEWNYIIHRPNKGDYSNLSYDYFLIGSNTLNEDLESSKEHTLIYSNFKNSNVIVYPTTETKDYVYNPLYFEYVERIREESTNISDINLNSTENSLPNNDNAKKGNLSYYFALLTLLSIFINIVF